MKSESVSAFNTFHTLYKENPDAAACLRSIPFIDELRAGQLLLPIEQGASLARADVHKCLHEQHDPGALYSEVCRHFGFSEPAARSLQERTMGDLVSSLDFDRVDEMLRMLKGAPSGEIDVIKLAAAFYAAFYDHSQPRKNEEKAVYALGYAIALQEACAAEAARDKWLGHEKDALLTNSLLAVWVVLMAALGVGLVFVASIAWQLIACLYLLAFFGGICALGALSEALEDGGTLHERLREGPVRERCRSLIAYVLSRRNSDKPDGGNSGEGAEAEAHAEAAGTTETACETAGRIIADLSRWQDEDSLSDETPEDSVDTE